MWGRSRPTDQEDCPVGATDDVAVPTPLTEGFRTSTFAGELGGSTSALVAFHWP
jgi:hypothetical protein